MIRNLGSCYIYLMISYAYMLKCVIETLYTHVQAYDCILDIQGTRTLLQIDVQCALYIRMYEIPIDTVSYYSIEQIRISGCNPCRAHRGRRDQLQIQLRHMFLPIFTGFVQGTRAQHISLIIKQSCTHLYKLYHAYHVKLSSLLL